MLDNTKRILKQRGFDIVFEYQGKPIAMSSDNLKPTVLKQLRDMGFKIEYEESRGIRSIVIYNEDEQIYVCGSLSKLLQLTGQFVTAWEVASVSSEFSRGMRQNGVSLVGSLILTNPDIGYFPGNLDCSRWNVEKVTSLNSVFCCREDLIYLDINNWNLSSCTNISSMLSGCTFLTGISMENLVIDPEVIRKAHGIFSGCYALKWVDVCGCKAEIVDSIKEHLPANVRLLRTEQDKMKYLDMNDLMKKVQLVRSLSPIVCRKNAEFLHNSRYRTKNLNKNPEKFRDDIDNYSLPPIPMHLCNYNTSCKNCISAINSLT